MATREWHIMPAGEEDAEAMVRLTTRTLAAGPQTITKYKDIPSCAYPNERQYLTPPEQLLAHRVRTRKKVITSKGIHTYKVMHTTPPACFNLEAMKHVQETMEAVQKEIRDSNGSDAVPSQPDYLWRLPVYVEASPLGKMFYQSCGFEVLRDVESFEGRAMLSAMILCRQADA
ncbi:uncharacterized protein MYCGRDRAFT_90565 [Zymoseptoria tritici IPO323]|uniref:Uncharacterized protein n=1 Tax=Zymoseptoria tritici (strain CBS 115943 / IPO323) TaxID=336722 RepID=F9X2R2_ZYMTI|nr:uncharacterized protein MYCGRDRAFT_90565 [Zymoseptoria tritici IPO323]EGP90648.1 hypothetical protein MYCGRDRAFT_90565 [Zymoseptoria tritici IPO323]